MRNLFWSAKTRSNLRTMAWRDIALVDLKNTTFFCSYPYPIHFSITKLLLLLQAAKPPYVSMNRSLIMVWRKSIVYKCSIIRYFLRLRGKVASKMQKYKWKNLWNLWFSPNCTPSSNHLSVQTTYLGSYKTI